MMLSYNANAQLTTTTSSMDANCPANDGWAKVTPSMGSGTYSYNWSTGDNVDSIGNLAAGTYYVTVYDVGAGTDTALMETFDGVLNWTLNTATGANDADANEWRINDDEGGIAAGGCAVKSNGNNTLYLGCTSGACAVLMSSGAEYDAGGFTAIETNKRAEYNIPIVTTGLSNLTLSFDWIGVGQAGFDFAELEYSTNSGATWNPITQFHSGMVCGGTTGQWANYSALLPMAAWNIADLRIAFNWTNNDDVMGSDPSFAVNDIRITYPTAGTDSVVDTIIVGQIGAPSIDLSGIVVTNPACGMRNGSITGIVATGGTPGYISRWDSAATNVDMDIDLSAAFAGVYTLYVTDALGCTYDTTFVLTGAGGGVVPITANATPDTICIGSGSNLTASGGTGGVYIWTGGDLGGPTPGASINVTPTSTQTYYVNWTDGGCNGNDSVEVTVLDVQEVVVSVTLPSCGANNGIIAAGATGGTGAYSVFIYNAMGANTFPGTSLGPGSYIVSAIDNNTGCTSDSTTVVLMDTTSFAMVTDTTYTPSLCFGDGLGSITLTVMGGTMPYTYTWGHDATLNAPMATGLNSGTTYTVQVADVDCPAGGSTLNLTVPGPTARLSATVTPIADNCNMGTGSASIVSMGGTMPHTYSWSTGASGPMISSLTPNAYSVTVNDFNGCDTVINFTIGNVGGPSAQANPVAPICPNDSDGVITVLATSSDGPFVFSWSHDAGVTGNSASGLTPGVYTVTVTNALSCDTVLNITVPVFASNTIDAGLDTVIRYGESARLLAVPSASNIMDVSWSPDTDIVDQGLLATVFPKQTTTYTVSGSFDNGCLVSDDITVYVDTILPVYNFPNVFTPNQDGVNDVYRINFNIAVSEFEIHIYDKWGNKVYEAFELNHGWDGTHYQTHERLNMGVYSYVAVVKTLISDVPVVESGNITLIR